MATPGEKHGKNALCGFLLCHTLECEPSHYVVWQKANHRNRHFPMIRENALYIGVATPAQKLSKIVWCGTRTTGTGQLEPDGARANHHGLVVEFVLEELLPLPPLEPFFELDC